MNVLLVYAHPEPKSLNGSLKDFAVQRLEAAGHQVRVSDLYAMQWKAPLDAGDSLAPANGTPFHPSLPRSTHSRTDCKVPTSHASRKS